jgi:hypothetical protein
MSTGYVEGYFNTIENRRIRDLLNELGFNKGRPILILGDGSKISIARPPKELLPKIIEALEWVQMTRGNVTFQRGPMGGGA